jgi:hypothetical protein
MAAAGRATPPAPGYGASPPRPGCGGGSRPTGCATPTPSSSGPLGISVRTLLDPENPNRAAALADVPDMSVFQEAMRSQEAADAMPHDGVRADTLVVLVEA